MARQVLRVPPDYRHPRDSQGFVPLECLPSNASGDSYIMYNTTNNTPISPVFGTPQQLAEWLSASRASFFAGTPTTYSHWLAIIEGRDYGLPKLLQQEPELGLFTVIGECTEYKVKTTDHQPHNQEENPDDLHD